MNEPPVIVIGAGIGGLATAIELAAGGTAVTMLERAQQPGGKMRELEIGGRQVDAGPTVLTMRWVFDELFERAGTRLETHVRLQPLQTLARHAWSSGAGGATLDLFGDIERSVDAIATFAGTADAAGYRGFCERAQRIYNVLEEPFLRSSRPTPLTLLARGGVRGLPDMLRISPFATLWSALGDHFRDPRLRQLFGRYATYCGSSPFVAPATLMLVAHVEREGVWVVDGGMQRLAQALAAAAAALGVRIRYAAHVDEIVVDGSRACGVRLRDGECITASAVVFNGDASALAQGLLGPAVARSVGAVAVQRRSLSAITWNLVARTSGCGLARHNVFFGNDSAREFDDLFVHARVPSDPTVYVCAQDQTEPNASDTQAPQRLLCLINAPAVGDTTPIDEKELERCERRMFQRLAQCGLSVQNLACPPLRTTPSTYAQMFPGSGGSLYGPASHGWMASFRRPGSRTRIPGLYLAGGTTHPGPGVPMAALSGRLAAASLSKDRASDRSSISRWHPAVMPGGTSTH